MLVHTENMRLTHQFITFKESHSCLSLKVSVPFLRGFRKHFQQASLAPQILSGQNRCHTSTQSNTCYFHTSQLQAAPPVSHVTAWPSQSSPKCCTLQTMGTSIGLMRDRCHFPPYSLHPPAAKDCNHPVSSLTPSRTCCRRSTPLQTLTLSKPLRMWTLRRHCSGFAQTSRKLSSRCQASLTWLTRPCPRL